MSRLRRFATSASGYPMTLCYLSAVGIVAAVADERLQTDFAIALLAGVFVLFMWVAFRRELANTQREVEAARREAKAARVELGEARDELHSVHERTEQIAHVILDEAS